MDTKFSVILNDARGLDVIRKLVAARVPFLCEPLLAGSGVFLTVDGMYQTAMLQAMNIRCESCGVEGVPLNDAGECGDCVRNRAQRNACRGCGADLSREGHSRDCENN